MIAILSRMNEKSLDIPRRALAFGAISFVVGMVLLQVVGGWAQARFALVGLALTEFMILVIAVLSAKASNLDLREVFRIRRSSGAQWLGSFTLYLGSFFGTATVSYLLAFFFPPVMQTSQEINEFISSGGFVLALIAVSLLPGICEEAWHRGYLLSALGSLKSVAVRVVIMGIVFGLFHLDPTRFLQTMILGFALSFMRIKTDNLMIPMVFHALNNLVSLALTFGASRLPSDLPEQTLQEAPTTPSQMPVEVLLPLLFFMVSLCVLFTALGRRVFKRIDMREADKARRTKTAQPPLKRRSSDRLCPPLH